MADRTTPMPGVDSGEFAPPGILAGRYVIERELGRGATATVYLARDTKYDRLVAAKTLNRELAFALGPSRFLREIEITARLQHPNILSIHDSGEIDGLLFYVTPYLEGDTLRARLTKERQLPVDVAVRITTELADALHYAHERGVVHRDIKPENILFSGGHACLADFGIAHAIQRAGGDRLTTTGLVLGTPAYMSPEQAAGERELDGRSDLYSLACVLYEMLAGMAPFIGPTPESVVAQRFSHMPRAVRAFRTGVPPHVERALNRALSLAPADRFADTRAFAEALVRPMTEEAEVPPTSVGRPKWTWRWAATGAATVVALGAGAMAVSRIGLWNPPLNASRVAVLPFAGTGGKQLTVESARRDLYDAFRRWRDLDLVDLGTVGQAVSGPITDKAGAAVGRKLGAGQLVQAVVTRVGDSVRVDAAMYDLERRRRTREFSIVVPDDRSVSADPYRRAVTALLLEPGSGLGSTAGHDLADNGTNSIVAWRAYQRGLSAVNRWKLTEAEREFTLAVSADANYPHAHLMLAQVASWSRDNQPDTWQESASRAVARSAGLTDRDKLLAQGVFALARRQFASACTAYERLLALDSLHVVAWFGRGECLTKDPTVVRDARSPSGWRFLTGQRTGTAAFLRALELAPDAHPVLSLQRRKQLFYASTNRYRIGLAARDSFAASPSFDRVGDSVAFVPFPLSAFASGDPRTVPTTLDLAVQQQRDMLLTLAVDWVRRDPGNADANEAVAHALESRGDLGISEPSGRSAIQALRIARAISTDSRQRVRLGVSEVRLLIKSSEFAAARVLADSMLTRDGVSAASDGALAGLAALTGRAGLTARLLRVTTESGSAGVNALLLGMRAPAQVRHPASELLASAALGLCDSVRHQRLRVERAIETHVEPNGRLAVWNGIVLRALSMAAPCDSGRAMLRAQPAQDPLMRMQQALARNDFAAVRVQLAALARARQSDRPGDVAIDHTYHEAWLLAAVGDTAEATHRLDQALDALPTLGDWVVQYVPQAAAVPRAMRLRAALARRLGQESVGMRWEERSRALVADQSVLSQMDHF